MGTRSRHGLRAAAFLALWAATVALAVGEGRRLRDADAATGSWLLLTGCSVVAVLSLYAASVALLRARAADDAERVSSRPPTRRSSRRDDRPPPRHLA